MNIIVPVDGSPLSLEAVSIAGSLARAGGHAVQLIHIVNCPDCAFLELSPEIRVRLFSELDARGKHVLAQARERLGLAGPAAHSEVIVSADSIADAIVRHAEKEHAGLVVIGSRGLDPSVRFHLGSVAAKVSRHAPCSVYVVKPAPAEGA